MNNDRLVWADVNYMNLFHKIIVYSVFLNTLTVKLYLVSNTRGKFIFKDSFCSVMNYIELIDLKTKKNVQFGKCHKKKNKTKKKIQSPKKYE